MFIRLHVTFKRVTPDQCVGYCTSDYSKHCILFPEKWIRNSLGILQHIEDPAWNKDSPPDFLPQTREFQQWYEDHPDPETTDSIHGTNMCLKVVYML